MPDHRTYGLEKEICMNRRAPDVPRAAAVPAWAALLAGAFLGVACTAPFEATGNVPLGSEFTLKPGESAFMQSTDLQVGFQGVVNDSRCPGDATCIQAGDAVVALQVGTAQVTLRSNTAPEQVVGIYRVRVTRVEPYPFASQPPIAPADYRATLVVNRR
jgi:hypothetical protein